MLLAFLLAAAAPASAGDTEAIKAIIIAGAEACARGDQAGVMRQYDRQVVLSFPGAPDRNYDDLAAGFARLCKGSGEGTVERTAPQFEELIVSEHTALVRIIWTTQLRGAASPRMLRDVQFWLKTPQGWRFRSGAHWPHRAEAAK